VQAFQQVLQQERSNIIREGPLVDAVRRIGLRLAKASEDPALRKAIHLPDMQFEWEFRVVRSNQVNAFCLPGGKIVVYTGILPVARTEAGLATVMGHEMAHATLRHGSERLLKQKATSTIMTGVQVSVGDMSYEQQRAVMG